MDGGDATFATLDPSAAAGAVRGLALARRVAPRGIRQRYRPPGATAGQSSRLPARQAIDLPPARREMRACWRSCGRSRPFSLTSPTRVTRRNSNITALTLTLSGE